MGFEGFLFAIEGFRNLLSRGFYGDKPFCHDRHTT